MESSTPSIKSEQIKALERKIRVKFRDPKIAEQAFVHKSYVNEHKELGQQHNERLEFLGDAVLEMVTTEYLYRMYPTSPEGKLTNFRSALVKGKHLSEVAVTLGLGEFLKLSRGEEKSGGREKGYILANALEALIGAIYLDRGFLVAHKFVDSFILKNLSEILEKGLHIDAKSQLQEWAQEKHNITPSYEVLRESGPDHHKQFEVAVYVGEKELGRGTGTSKQAAQQASAEDAVEKHIKPEF